MSCRARPALALSALAFAVAAAVDERAVLAAACDAAAGKGCACCEANDATLLPPALVVSCRARPLLASSALAFALAAAVDERAVLAAACGAAAGEGCACCI